MIRTLVGNTIIDRSGVVGAAVVGAATVGAAPILSSWLNRWLQWIVRRQQKYEARNV